MESSPPAAPTCGTAAPPVAPEASRDFPYRLERFATLRGHTGRVWSCAWSPGGAYLLTTGADGSARVWSRRSGKSTPLVPLPTPSGALAFASSPDVGVEPAGASVSEQFDCLQVLDGVHARTARCGAWAPSGRYVAIASFDRSISLWELSGGVFECIATLEGHQEGHEIKWVSWAGSGDLLASCSRDKSVLVWASDSGPGEWECCAALTGHTQDVKQVRFHPSQELLVSTSYDGTARVWLPDEDDWFCAATLAHHTDTVWGMSFAPDASAFATVSADRSLAVWSAAAAAAVAAEGAAAGGGARAWPLLVSAQELHRRPVLTVDWGRPLEFSGAAAASAAAASSTANASLTSEQAIAMGSALQAALLSLPASALSPSSESKLPTVDALIIAAGLDTGSAAARAAAVAALAAASAPAPAPGQGVIATGGGDDALTVLFPTPAPVPAPASAPVSVPEPATVASVLRARGAATAAAAAAAAAESKGKPASGTKGCASESPTTSAAAAAAAAAIAAATAATAAAAAAASSSRGNGSDKGHDAVAQQQAVQPSPFSSPYSVDADAPRFFPAATPPTGSDCGAISSVADGANATGGKPVPFSGLYTAACCSGAHRGDVNCVAWHPKRRNVLASAGDDGLVHVWRLVPSAAALQPVDM